MVEVLSKNWADDEPSGCKTRIGKDFIGARVAGGFGKLEKWCGWLSMPVLHRPRPNARTSRRRLP